MFIHYVHLVRYRPRPDKVITRQGKVGGNIYIKKISFLLCLSILFFKFIKGNMINLEKCDSVFIYTIHFS